MLDGITSIGSYAFYYILQEVINIIIPNSVVSIGISVFESMVYLRTITLPDSVEVIPIKAFSGCTRLESINFFW